MTTLNVRKEGREARTASSDFWATVSLLAVGFGLFGKIGLHPEGQRV